MIVPPTPRQLDPTTPFTIGGQPMDFTVKAFWTWAYSGLIDNKNRGVLAEFIVAHGLGIDSPAHDSWGTHDLISPSGTEIEVKATSYLQSWNQRELSRPVWQGLRSRRSEMLAAGGWSMADEHTAKGHLFVLCLFTATEHATADPLNLDQWAFWLVPGGDVTSDSLALSTVEKKHRRLAYPGLSPAFEALEPTLRR